MARFSRAARQGDSIRGRCSIPIHTKHHHCPHFLTGNCSGGSNVYIEGKPAQKEGDNVTFSTCQHGGAGTIVEGSGSVQINGRAAARIKDTVNCGTCSQKSYIVEGAASVFIGD